MTLETFRGPDLSRVLGLVRAACGEDAMIVRTRSPAETPDGLYEVVVAEPEHVERLRAVLQGERRADAARVHAFVGPAGAGKTTSIAKLALHASAFGGRSVGLLTLDTYRVAAVEQLQTYAEIAGLPFDVAYDEADLEAAMRRLDRCDVVLVDTPGRSRHTGGDSDWMTLLPAAAPDEVHLVLPAGVRTDVALAARHAYAACGITHVLLTKLDEVPFESGVADLAAALQLPCRWVADGPEVPVNLATGPGRILHSLGSAPAAPARIAV